MDFVENVWVCKERAEAGLGAEIDHSAAVFRAREVCLIGVTKDPSAEGDEARSFLLFQNT